MVRVESFGQLAGILVDQHRDLRVVRQGARDSWLTSMAEFLSFSSQLPLLVVCTDLASAIVLLVFASAAPLVAAAAVWSEAMGPSSVRDSERETVEPVTPAS